MGKKTKLGKDRLDKYYQLAKDQGFRARSAFKLIQLVKRFDFLSKSKICIDLCGAPGGWSQVAAKNMPYGSQILCVDLVPIKPIRGVTCVQADITTQKCKAILKKEMKGGKADCVLNDGAPNVGASWTHDAFSQAELTLSATKLACEHLRPGGTFVTKVFRSSDYNSLLWVFQQLFTKVDATKPQASRNVSAEIFVLCTGFKAPAKLDQRLLDPKFVFMEDAEAQALEGSSEVEAKKKASASLNDHFKSEMKKRRGGYGEGDDYRTVTAKEFFASKNAANILVTSHQIVFSSPECKVLLAHPLTTKDVTLSCEDLKVLGKGEMAALLKWRMKILRERARERRSAAGDSKDGAPAEEEEDALGAVPKKSTKKSSKAGDEEGKESASDDDDDDLEGMIDRKRAQEKAEAKKAKEELKKKAWRKKMSMGSHFQSQEEPDLFRMNSRSLKLLAQEDGTVDFAAQHTHDTGLAEEESEEEEPADPLDQFDEDEEDRIAQMELDVAIAEQLKKEREAVFERSKVQRQSKNKKETKKQQMASEWSSTMSAFNNEIDARAEDEYLRRENARDSENEEEDDDDDEETEEEEEEEDENTIKNEAGPTRGVEEVDPSPAEGFRVGQREKRWFSSDLFKGLKDLDADERAEARKRAELAQARQVAGLDEDGEDAKDEDGEAFIGKELDDKNVPHLPLNDKQKRQLKRKKEAEKEELRKAKRRKREGPDSTVDDDDKEDFDLVPAPALLEDGEAFPGFGAGAEGAAGGFERPSDPQELAETLAMGSLLIRKKSRIEFLDSAYNRYAFDESHNEALPDWFLEEENQFNKPELPISKELMDQFRAKMREVNARPIKKVAEAQARKKKRLHERLEKLRKKAQDLTANPDMSAGAKAREMQKMVSKAKRQDKRQVAYLTSGKAGGGKQVAAGKLRGAKVKVVDRRMKNDKRHEKRADQRKGKYGRGGRKNKKSGGRKR